MSLAMAWWPTWSVVVTWISLCFICTITIFNLWWKYGPVGRKMARVPWCKTPWPLVGNLFHIICSPEGMWDLLREACRKHQGINKLSSFNVHYINIYDPDDIEGRDFCVKTDTVLQKIMGTSRFNQKRDPYTFLRPWLCEGLLVSNGEKWHQRRKILTSAFHFRILRKFSHTFGAHAEALVKTLQPHAHGRPVHLMPILSRATLTVMCETSMGISMHERLQAVSEKYFNNVKYLGASILYRFARVWLHPWTTFSMTFTWRKQKEAVDNLHEFTDSIINERKIFWEAKADDCSQIENEYEDYGGKKGRHAMLDLLLQSSAEGLIDSRGIREEVDTFMFEGYDTTAVALQYLLLCIANEPEAQNGIYEEQRRIFGDSERIATTEDLAEMQYLECCVKEALRLYPSVPYIARYIHEEVTLSGYVIPPGTVCNIHIFDVHRNEDIYPDPERFKPERFLSKESTNRHPFAYLPFSAGPRNCIGQKFAMLELKALTSCVVRSYHLSTVTRREDLRFLTDFTLRTSHPVLMRLTPRE